MEEALIKRVMPHSVEAEQSVVGAMLMDKMRSPLHQRSSVVRIFIRHLTEWYLIPWWNFLTKESRSIWSHFRNV